LSEPYVSALCEELRLRKDLVQTLKTIYIGGGTPSLLTDQNLMQLFACIRESYTFSPSIEITIEANPGTLHESQVDTMLSLGINRLSIGIQSFHNDELKTIGRAHTVDDSLKSLDLFKRKDIENISLDLMYGIPCQTVESLNTSIKNAVDFSPTHISVYELTPEEKTPLHDFISEKKVIMPDEEQVISMYNHAREYLGKSCYQHYEISNFAKNGFQCTHNNNYWDRGEYIGFGAGAHSFINDIRSKNITDIEKYINIVHKGRMPVIESFQVTPLDAIKEHIFLGLRKTRGLKIEDIQNFGLAIPDAAQDLIDNSFLKIENGYLRFTKKGITISNTIIVRLFENLGI
jgi:oxygen-independent coproporphyrinogen-3 oxidase